MAFYCSICAVEWFWVGVLIGLCLVVRRSNPISWFRVTKLYFLSKYLENQSRFGGIDFFYFYVILGTVISD